jgi:hypothetical protein
MKTNVQHLIATHAPGFAWLVQAVGPRDGVLRLTDDLWAAVEPWVGPHRLAGLLYDGILLGTIEAPRWVRYELSARLMRWTEATRDWPELAGAVLDELHRRGVPNLVLKGWALIPLVYEGRRELRVASDLDLLISRESLMEADAVLREEGFVIPPQAEVWPGFAHKYSHEAQYIRSCGSRRPLGVDLHWQVMGNPQLWPHVGHDWFPRAQEVVVEGRRMSVPATEDLFLHLCAHEVVDDAREPVTPLYRLVDLLRLAARPGFSWSAVLERARVMSLPGSLRTCVETLHALWPAAIPTAVLDNCRRIPGDVAEEQAYRDNLARTHPLKPSPDPRWIPGWGARLEYVLGKLFPSAAFLRSAHHLPPGASYIRGLCARYGTRLSAWRHASRNLP